MGFVVVIAALSSACATGRVCPAAPPSVGDRCAHERITTLCAYGEPPAVIRRRCALAAHEPDPQWIDAQSDRVATAAAPASIAQLRARTRLHLYVRAVGALGRYGDSAQTAGGIGADVDAGAQVNDRFAGFASTRVRTMIANSTIAIGGGFEWSLSDTIALSLGAQLSLTLYQPPLSSWVEGGLSVPLQWHMDLRARGEREVRREATRLSLEVAPLWTLSTGVVGGHVALGFGWVQH